MLKPNRSELERHYQMDYRASEQRTGIHGGRAS